MGGWEMWAVRLSDGLLHNIGDRWYAEHHLMPGEELVPVLVEDTGIAIEKRPREDIPRETGTHFGWFGRDREGVEEDEPAMIQPHWGMFSMQFTYGPMPEVKAGRGRIALLRIQPREVHENHPE